MKLQAGFEAAKFITGTFISSLGATTVTLVNTADYDTGAELEMCRVTIKNESGPGAAVAYFGSSNIAAAGANRGLPLTTGQSHTITVIAGTIIYGYGSGSPNVYVLMEF